MSDLIVAEAQSLQGGVATEAFNLGNSVVVQDESLQVLVLAGILELLDLVVAVVDVFQASRGFEVEAISLIRCLSDERGLRLDNLLFETSTFCRYLYF